MMLKTYLTENEIRGNDSHLVKKIGVIDHYGHLNRIKPKSGYFSYHYFLNLWPRLQEDDKTLSKIVNSNKDCAKPPSQTLKGLAESNEIVHVEQKTDTKISIANRDFNLH